MKVVIVISGVLVALALFVAFARKTSATIEVERTFQAPLNRVWHTWTDEESMKQWWSPKGYTAPLIRHDFREGGTFLLSMRSPGGEMSWNTGTYRQIVPGQKIVSTMSFSDENGKAVAGADVTLPGEWPDEVLVTTEFTEINGATRVRVREEGVPLIIKVLAKMGWEQQYDKLEALLAR